MKRIVRLNESDFERIVNRVISEDEQMVAGGNQKSCKAVGVKYGKFIGEKDGNGYLEYHVDKNNKPTNVYSEDNASQKCTFKKYDFITLSQINY